MLSLSGNSCADKRNAMVRHQFYKRCGYPMETSRPEVTMGMKIRGVGGETSFEANRTGTITEAVEKESQK